MSTTQAIIMNGETRFLTRSLRSLSSLQLSRLRWQVLAAFFVVLFMRLPFIGVAPGNDEGGYTAVAAQWHMHGTSLYGNMWLDRPPLFLAMLKGALTASVALGGTQMFGIRVLGLIVAFVVSITCGLIARRIAGASAGLPAMLVAAAILSSVTIQGFNTNGELLASSFGTLAVLIAVKPLLATGSVPLRRANLYLLSAGFLAGCATLVKQSFLDSLATIALATLVATMAASAGRQGLLRKLLLQETCIGAGFLLAWAVALVSIASIGMSMSNVLYASWEFRAHAVQFVNVSVLKFALTHALGLVGIIVISGLGPLLIPILMRLRNDHALGGGAKSLLLAWPMFVVACILVSGGFYHHYLTQLVPPTAVIVGVVLAREVTLHRRRLLIILTAATITWLMAWNVAVASWVEDHPYQSTDIAITSYFHANAEPNDTLIAVYTRAGLLQSTGLKTPYPFAWGLLVTVYPHALNQLDTLLASNNRPTWIIQWQATSYQNMDLSGHRAALIAELYHPAHVVCGYTILVRNDVRRTNLVPPFRSCGRDLRIGPLLFVDHE